MANKKTRRSKNSGLQTVGGIGAGLLAGSLVVPKVVGAIDPNQKIDPKIVSAVGAAAGYMVGRRLSGFTQMMAYGFAAGQALNVVASVAGLGYVDSPTYDVNRVAGAGDTFPFGGTAGANPGSV